MSARIWAAIVAQLTPRQRNNVGKLVDLSSPPDFLEYARSLFPSPGTVTSDGRSLIQNLVIVWGVLLPEGLAHEHALEIADQAQRVEAIDVQLIRILNEYAEDRGDQEATIVRGLDLIDRLGPKHFLTMPLVKFMRHPSPKVRSKAAKIIGQLTSNQFWIDRNSTELDPRVRSNLLEAMAQNPEIDKARLRNLLFDATRDPHRRVSVTALYLLAQMGDQPSLVRLNTLQKDADPAMRKSADWAISKLTANT
jgi:hypothetical protein